MSKMDKLIIKLINISYANMVFNALLSKIVVATLLSKAGAPEVFDKEIDNINKAIDEYARKLAEDLEDKPDGR